jgi:hypothetical protein
MSEHGALAAARRARPKLTVNVNGETFRVRMPSMLALRQFEETRKAGDPADAIAVMLRECVLGENDAADLSQEDARQLADMAWASQALLEAILKFAHGGTEDPGPGGPEGGDTPQPDAG